MMKSKGTTVSGKNVGNTSATSKFKSIANVNDSVRDKSG